MIKHVLGLFKYPSLVFALHLNAQASTKETRIITLSPHLTEIVFALGKGDLLVGVSDYSDYPASAVNLPRVASYEGANLADIIRLQPTHILAWRGGNKDADIEKLKNMDVKLYESSIDSVDSLLTDINNIGQFLNANTEASKLLSSINSTIASISERYQGQVKTAIYYLSAQPFMGLGNDKWLNSLLSLCGIENIYVDSMSAYPQLQMADIIRKQPNVIIAGSNAPSTSIEAFWSPHSGLLQSQIILANPDALHRFTNRAIGEMETLCAKTYPSILQQ